MQFMSPDSFALLPFSSFLYNAWNNPEFIPNWQHGQLILAKEGQEKFQFVGMNYVLSFALLAKQFTFVHFIYLHRHNLII